MINEREVLKTAGRDAIVSFLRSRSVFELVRTSGKVRILGESNCTPSLAGGGL